MSDFNENEKPVERKYQQVHCPNCGGTDVQLAGGKGSFIGNVGSMIFRHNCNSCNSGFTLVVTGDEMFPNRGFGFVKKDLNIPMGKSERNIKGAVTL